MGFDQKRAVSRHLRFAIFHFLFASWAAFWVEPFVNICILCIHTVQEVRNATRTQQECHNCHNWSFFLDIFLVGFAVGEAQALETAQGDLERAIDLLEEQSKKTESKEDQNLKLSSVEFAP